MWSCFFFHTPQSIKDQQTYQKQEDFCWMLISKTWPLCLFTDVSFFSGESLTSVNISRAAGMPRSSKGNTRFLLGFFFFCLPIFTPSKTTTILGQRLTHCNRMSTENTALESSIITASDCNPFTTGLLSLLMKQQDVIEKPYAIFPLLLLLLHQQSLVGSSRITKSKPRSTAAQSYFCLNWGQEYCYIVSAFSYIFEWLFYNTYCAVPFFNNVSLDYLPMIPTKP